VHEPIFFAGRYLKLSRTLPQTAWMIQGEKKLATSIEEIVGEVIKKELGAIEYVFTASGREDIDVKCLGKGE
jgi:tRNA pseudouridine synthase 10